MNIDTIRGLNAHLTASIVVLAGLLSIIWMTAIGTIPPDVGLPAIVAIVSGAAGFVWGSETSKQASKEAARNIMQQPPDAQNPPPTP